MPPSVNPLSTIELGTAGIGLVLLVVAGVYLISRR